MSANDPFNLGSNQSIKAFEDAHNQSDTDFDPHSMHHTLGRGPTQAARGNHNHSGVYALVDHTHIAQDVGQVFMWLGSSEPPGCLFLNGQGITRDNYPSLFDVMEVPVGTDFIYLPDYRDAFPVGASAGNVLKTRYNTTQLDLSTNEQKAQFVTDVIDNNAGTDGSALALTKADALTGITSADVPLPTRVAINFVVKAA